MGLLRLIVSIFIIILLVMFILLNRADVDVFWNPLGAEALTLPIYLIALGAMSIGFLFGGLTAWMNMSAIRKERRALRRTVKQLEKELKRLQDNKFSATPTAPVTDIMPAIQMQKAS